MVGEALVDEALRVGFQLEFSVVTFEVGTGYPVPVPWRMEEEETLAGPTGVLLAGGGCGM
jgi:hypothetical protein